MELIASLVLIIAVTILIWLYSGQPEYPYRNRVVVRVFWGATLLYFIYKMFLT